MNPRRQPELKKAGITAVLNVAQDLMNNQTNMHKEFMMAHVPLTDGGNNSVSMCRLAVDALDTFIKEGRKVLVHCHVGKSRSASVVGTWMVTNGLASSLDEAESLIKAKRDRVEMQSDLKALFQQVIDNYDL